MVLKIGGAAGADNGNFATLGILMTQLEGLEDGTMILAGSGMKLRR